MDDPDGYFGADVAARYDESTADMSAPEAVEPVVTVLAALAAEHPGGRALELAVGTGRIALPRAARGVPVHGIELSRAMVARLQAKAGADSVAVTVGDMATTRVPGEFAVAYLVFNTVMNLTTQDAQVDCFRNAAAHLRPGGCFVVEVMVPDLQRLPPGQDAVMWRTDPDGWAFDRYDVVTQEMSSHYATLAGDAWVHRSIPFRYVWPAELDLMARLAGMRLRHRWADWSKAPFTAESRSHVSVWEKASATG